MKSVTPNTESAYSVTSLEAWLRLTHTPGLGNVGQRKLLSSFGLPEKAYLAGQNAVRTVIGHRLTQAFFALDTAPLLETLQKWLTLPENHFITLADTLYPQKLLELSDPPSVLYVKGNIALLNRPALAIVGARTATPQGRANAKAFAQTLCEAGLTIVSGLALGIDGAAHEGALASQAPASTLAVLGTGLDRIYPSSHANLARSMAEKGVLISEFSLGTPAQQHNFPRRNRLIAGLSLGVLVVEAAAASGSLITARLAGENGREVFAIPGSIHAPLSKGCHALIKEGAKLVESAHDILSELPNFSLPASIPTQTITPTQTTTQSETTSIHQSILEALGHDPINLDQLAERTQMQVESLNIALLELELTGIIAKLPGQKFQRL